MKRPRSAGKGAQGTPPPDRHDLLATDSKQPSEMIENNIRHVVDRRLAVTGCIKRAVCLDKVVVDNWTRNSLPFTEPGGPLSCSQQTATGPCPVSPESSPHPPMLLILNVFCPWNVYLGVPRGLFPSGFPATIKLRSFQRIHPSVKAYVSLRNRSDL
jgi:hypothetical protein